MPPQHPATTEPMTEHENSFTPEIRPKGFFSILRASLRAMRPHQWLKNGFVLAPLVFSKEFADVERSSLALGAMAAFCGASSGVYLLNDLFDIEADKLHPKKRFRPLASGELPIPAGWTLAAILMFGAVAASFLFLGRSTALITASYIALNVVYTFSFKHIAYLDAVCIASGFCLRIAAGSFATSISVSAYLWGITALLALYLAFGKRYHELSQELRETKQRKALRGYSKKTLEVLLAICGTGVLLAYGKYTFSAHAQEELGTELMPITIPFVAFGALRFFTLARKATADPPTDAMLRDLGFVVNGLLWCAITVGILISC